MIQRFAVYFTPSDAKGALAGAAWLGWDCVGGRAVDPLALAGLDLPGLTRKPRKYGFHATLKAPFFLRPDLSEDHVLDRVATLADGLAPAPLGPLTVDLHFGCLALVPDGPRPQADAIAAHCVRGLDDLRAPLTDAQIARRGRLTDRQDRHLRRWGYPFVFEDHRFHMTLSGKLNPDTADRLRPLAEAHFAPWCRQPVHLDALSVMRSDAEGRFHLHARLPLTGKPPLSDG